MKYLLDTHTILWLMVGSKRIPREVLNIVDNPNNQVFYSTVSAWEIELKHLKHKSFKLSGEQFVFLCDQNYLINIPVYNQHISCLKGLVNKKHNDPFDKLLLSQAMSENMTFITHDKNFKNYKCSNIYLY